MSNKLTAVKKILEIFRRASILQSIYGKCENNYLLRRRIAFSIFLKILLNLLEQLQHHKHQLWDKVKLH